MDFIKLNQINFQNLYNRKEIEMKTKEQIEKKVRELESDPRMGYKMASIEINAPLALIQCSIGSIIDILKWVLEEE